MPAGNQDARDVAFGATPISPDGPLRVNGTRFRRSAERGSVEKFSEEVAGLFLGAFLGKRLCTGIIGLIGKLVFV